MTGEQCFLDDDDWRSVQVHDNSFLLMPNNSSIYHDGLNHFATIPGLLQRFKCLGKGDPPMQCAMISSTAEHIRSNIMDWFNRMQSEFEQPIRLLLPSSSSPHMILPLVYEYRDIITASFIVNYSAYLLQINSIIDSCKSSNEYMEENIELSKDICMSTSYLLRAGFCGAQAMAFALPFALSALPEEYSGWIQQQTYAFEHVQESLTLRSAMWSENSFTKP
jgi:hypothetical protein